MPTDERHCVAPESTAELPSADTSAESPPSMVKTMSSPPIRRPLAVAGGEVVGYPTVIPQVRTPRPGRQVSLPGGRAADHGIGRWSTARVTRCEAATLCGKAAASNGSSAPPAAHQKLAAIGVWVKLADVKRR